MHFHWQNLNDKKHGRAGSPLRYGRAWWRLGGRSAVNWEWTLFHSSSCRIGITVGGSEEFGFHWCLALPWLFSFYLTVAGFRPVVWLARLLLPKMAADGTQHRMLHGYPDEREIRFSIHDWSIWWSVWRNPMAGWSRAVPRWRDGNFHPLDVLLGKVDYSTRVLKSTPAMVPMPEGSYAATVELFESTWKRPRWFATRMVRADVKLEKGIPFPGKGENSYDCGEDALHGLTTKADTIEEAIAETVQSALRSRRRYGGSIDWRPATNGAA